MILNFILWLFDCFILNLFSFSAWKDFLLQRRFPHNQGFCGAGRTEKRSASKLPSDLSRKFVAGKIAKSIRRFFVLFGHVSLLFWPTQILSWIPAGEWKNLLLMMREGGGFVFFLDCLLAVSGLSNNNKGAVLLLAVQCSPFCKWCKWLVQYTRYTHCTVRTVLCTYSRSRVRRSVLVRRTTYQISCVMHALWCRSTMYFFKIVAI